MRTTTVAIVFLSIFMSATGVTLDKIIRQDWELYKATYNKSYPEEAEDMKRLKIYLENSDFVKEHNKLYEEGKTTFTVALNKFADWTKEEIDESLHGCKISLELEDLIFHNSTHDEDDDQPPDEVNWVEKGAVTSVKDQENCGSCYAFSAVGALEGQYFLNSGKLVNLSVQNLVDCSRDFGNKGCQGGFPSNCFDYVESSNGIDTWEEYPYRNREGRCRFKPANAIAKCTGYDSVPTCEKCLQKTVAKKGPVSVAIDASKSDFIYYQSGVYQNSHCSSRNLDHAVLAVGYGTDKTTGEAYWLLKNSWGTGWGEDGYIKLARNKNNMCGVASLATVPEM